MSYEIEQKYRVSDHADVAARLPSFGARRGETLQQSDAYYGHPARDFAQTGEAFRIRTDGPRNALTYKGPKHAGPTKTREETEVAFESGTEAHAKMRRLLESLGFRPVLVVRKTRTPYHVDYRGRGFEVVLDDAEGLGSFVEVEAVVGDDEPLAPVQELVMSLAAELGLTELEPRSYLRMALEKVQGSVRLQSDQN